MSDKKVVGHFYGLMGPDAASVAVDTMLANQAPAMAEAVRHIIGFDASIQIARHTFTLDWRERDANVADAALRLWLNGEADQDALQAAGPRTVVGMAVVMNRQSIHRPARAFNCRDARVADAAQYIYMNRSNLPPKLKQAMLCSSSLGVIMSAAALCRKTDTWPRNQYRADIAAAGQWLNGHGMRQSILRALKPEEILSASGEYMQRQRQATIRIRQSVWDCIEERATQPVDDSQYAGGIDLASAGMAYAMVAADLPEGFAESYYPWENHTFKPRDKRKNLVKAVALLLAQIDLLDDEVKRGGQA